MKDTGEQTRRQRRQHFYHSDSAAGPLPPADKPPHNLEVPRIVGDSKIGSVVEAVPGRWEGTPTPQVAGQWYSGGVAVSGATTPKYTITVQDENLALQYREAATNSMGIAEAASNTIHVQNVVIGGLPFDKYSTTFARGYWNQSQHPTVPLLDGLVHYVKPSLAASPGPNGEIFADLAEMQAFAGASWFDNNGELGKILVDANGTDILASQMADAIAQEMILEVRYVKPDLRVLLATPPHPVLTSGFSDGFSTGFGA